MKILNMMIYALHAEKKAGLDIFTMETNPENPEKVNKILKNPEMKRKIPDDICMQRRGRVLADRIMGARFRALKQTLTPLNLLQLLCIFSIARFYIH